MNKRLLANAEREPLGAVFPNRLVEVAGIFGLGGSAQRLHSLLQRVNLLIERINTRVLRPATKSGQRNGQH